MSTPCLISRSYCEPSIEEIEWDTPAHPQSLSCSGERVSLVERNIKSFSLYYLPCFSQCQSLPKRWRTPPTVSYSNHNHNHNGWVHFLFQTPKVVLGVGQPRAKSTYHEPPSPEPGPDPREGVYIISLIRYTHISIEIRSRHSPCSSHESAYSFFLQVLSSVPTGLGDVHRAPLSWVQLLTIECN